MTFGPAGPPAPVAASPAARTLHGKVAGCGMLSPGQLARVRFSRHRLAVFSLCLLVLLFGTALLAEFFAPYGKLWKDGNYAHCPPQLPVFSLNEGLHVKGVERRVDRLTSRTTYRIDPRHIVPLSFFTRGEPYQLLGVIRWDRRFIGVDAAAYAARHGEAGYTGTASPDPEGDAVSPPQQPTFYFLGADQAGGDIFSRLFFAGRISLSIGLAAAFLCLIFGVTIGGVSAFIGGAAGGLIERLSGMVNLFPQLPFWLFLAAVVPGDWSPLATSFAIIIVLSLLKWAIFARVVRGTLVSLRNEDHAVAARLLGARRLRMLFRHLVPGAASHVLVVLTLAVPGLILGETVLSLLELGLRPPIVSWGVMLQDTMNVQAVARYPWILLPVLPVVLTVLCFNLVGDGLRHAADIHPVG